MAVDTAQLPETTPAGRTPPRRRRGGVRRGEQVAGWLFISPVVVILGVFMLLPILMALWVSLTAWNGQGSPFQPGVPMAGGGNYSRLFTVDGLARENS